MSHGGVQARVKLRPSPNRPLATKLAAPKNDQSGVAICGTPFGVVGPGRGLAHDVARLVQWKRQRVQRQQVQW